MTAAPLALSDLTVGQELARTEHELTRDTLVRYAGASGDFNPIHYNDTAAQQAGLPGVIAHGMLTMGTAITGLLEADRKSTRLNSSHVSISYAVFCLKKKKKQRRSNGHICNHR